MMTHAQEHGPKLFVTIRRELAEGVGVLEASMRPQLAKLITYGMSVLSQFQQNTLSHEVARSDQLDTFRSVLNEIPELKTFFPQFQ